MITANGAPIVALRLTLPLSGLWVATMEVDAAEALAGELTIAQTDTKASYRGSVVTSGMSGGTCVLMAVGGLAAGLVRDASARSYRSATAKTVAAELLQSVGERLASSSSSLAATLPFWTRPHERVTQSLMALAAALGIHWRVLADGTVWMGTETWAPVEMAALELNRDPAASMVLLDADSISLMPGCTLHGDRVARVEHAFGREESLRTSYWVAS